MVSFTFLILSLNLINAVELDPYTILNSTGLNTTINITQITYCDQVNVDLNDIYLVNCSLDNSFNQLTYNLTTSNQRYNSSNLPYFIGTDVNSKTIYSNFSINSTVNLLVLSCSSVGRITYTSASGTIISYTNNLFQNSYTCSNNVVTLTVQLDKGINTFSINNADGGGLTACNSTLNAFLGYCGLLGLVGTVFFLCLALMWLMNIGDKKTISSALTIGSVVSIIMIGILLIVAVFIFSSVCTII